MSPSLHSQIIPLHEVPFEEFRNPIILVVDDEPLVADTLSAILSRAGFTILTAYNGTTALKLASDHIPELLISDVSMPDMNGVELALALLEARPECKVLLFSGHATSVDLVSALDAGYDLHLLAKPVHPTDMLKHIAKALHVPERITQPLRRAEVIPIRRSA